MQCRQFRISTSRCCPLFDVVLHDGSDANQDHWLGDRVNHQNSTCPIIVFPSNCSTGDQSGDGEESDGPWQDALLDILLAQLSRPGGTLPTAPLRDAVDVVFAAVCQDLTPTGQSFLACYCKRDLGLQNGFAAKLLCCLPYFAQYQFTVGEGICCHGP